MQTENDYLHSAFNINTFIYFAMLLHCGLMQYNDTFMDHHILNEKHYTEN